MMNDIPENYVVKLQAPEKNDDNTLYLNDFTQYNLFQMFCFLFRESKTREDLFSLEHYLRVVMDDASRMVWEEMRNK